MTKTEAIRDVLRTAGRPLSLDELRARLERKLKQIIGKARLYTTLSLMIHSKDLDSVGRADKRFYWFR